MYENVGPSNGNSVSTHICCIGVRGTFEEKIQLYQDLDFQRGEYLFFKYVPNVGPLQWKIDKFLRPSHSYISMLPLSTTWAGGHSKTNIPDIMYISDFYSSSFLHADHETIDWTVGL